MGISIYLVMFLVGLLGLAVMAALGAMHGHGSQSHGHGHSHAHGHHGGTHLDAHGHAPAASHAPMSAHGHGPTTGANTHADGDANANADADSQGDGDANVSAAGGMAMLVWLMPLLSPLNWSSWLIGAGATGMVGRLLALPEPVTIATAIGGAWVFNTAIVKPIWNLVFRFASRPAGNLESCLMQEVEAATGFNDRGEGLVRVLIDGHTEDVLARLTPELIGRGERVHRGDRLLIEEVDPHTNSCRVSRA